MGNPLSGMQPNWVYDPAQDPKIIQWQKAEDSLTKLLVYLAGEKEADRKLDYSIFQGELASIRNKGLVVDAEQYYSDSSYRKSIKKEESDYVHVITKAKEFSSESAGSISPIIQSTSSLIGLFPDFSVEHKMKDDLITIRKVLIEGDEELNEPAISKLSEEEIGGIDGLEHELKRMGLWRDGENWETKDSVIGVREQLNKRLDWFTLGYKEQNVEYVATQSDADAIINSALQTASSTLGLVREFQVVKDMENVDEKWLHSHTNLFPQDEVKHGTKIFDSDPSVAKYIDQDDYWKKYQMSSFVYGKSIQDLHGMSQADPRTYSDIMKGLQLERPDVYGSVASLVYVYDKGRKLISQVEAGIDKWTYLDLQKASLTKLEDLETAQGDLTKIAQESAFLRLIQSGDIKPPGYDIAGINDRIVQLDQTYAKYLQFRGEQYKNGEFTLRIDELTPLYDNFFSRHTSMLFEEPGEVHPKEREEYVQSIQDLDYNNVINSLDLLMGD
jgi:hypothetical protein